MLLDMITHSCFLYIRDNEEHKQNREQLSLTQCIKVRELFLHLFLQNIFSFSSNFGHKEKTSEKKNPKPYKCLNFMLIFTSVV